MVQAIQELAKQSFFKELKFFVAGDGALFDQTVKPLKKYDNVHVEKRFFRQEELAELYQEYGIVLIPSRGDTQGVSRDEAMSCGLVAVTNAVAAIPEFVDESCAVLAPDEDYKALAQGVVQMYQDPKRYIEMSQKAAERVRSQTSRPYTIDRELQLILDC